MCDRRAPPVPPVSDPRATAHWFAATAAAEPPDDPPGVLDRSQGLRVTCRGAGHPTAVRAQRGSSRGLGGWGVRGMGRGSVCLVEAKWEARHDLSTATVDTSMFNRFMLQREAPPRLTSSSWRGTSGWGGTEER